MTPSNTGRQRRASSKRRRRRLRCCVCLYSVSRPVYGANSFDAAAMQRFCVIFGSVDK